MVVETEYGKIRGKRERDCEVFLGIPYAKPPIGPLRFRRPVRRTPGAMCWNVPGLVSSVRSPGNRRRRTGAFP